MTTATLTRVQVGDEFADMSADAAKVVTAALKRRERELAKARKEYAQQTTEIAKDAAARQEELDRLDAEIESVDAQIDKLEAAKVQADADMLDLVNERIDTIGKANAILGQDWQWPTDSTEGIKRYVVISVLGDRARSYGDAEIAAAFETIKVPQQKRAVSVPQVRDAKQVYDARIGSAWKDPTVH